jgi:transcriptional regulator of acetoin/glycerol metabolism
LPHLDFGDPRMAAQSQLAARVIQRKIPIILRGQTSTCKEVFANALHSISPSAAGSFVAVNCASLPETLIESALFGYRAGAFTGAQREGPRGNGMLFLYEIGDMPMALQARLLQMKQIMRPTCSAIEAPQASEADSTAARAAASAASALPTSSANRCNEDSGPQTL